jgi:hypothetical protein
MTVRLKADTTYATDESYVVSGFSRTPREPSYVVSGFSRTVTAPTLPSTL